MTTNMVFCRGCGKPIHSSAPTCPHCGAPQGYAPSATDSPKNRVTAGVLALLLGGVGIHKFYTGSWGWGIVYIVLCWTFVPGIVALVEGIRYLTLSQTEFQHKAAQLNGPFSFLW
jgi:TM2 domain-containing membrane protein YozV